MLENRSDRIGDILRDMGVLTSVDITRILLEQQRTHQRFGQIAIAWKLASEEQVYEAWARQLVAERRSVDLDDFGVDPQALELFTAEQARQFRALPLRRWGSHLVVALVSMSLDCQILKDIARASRLEHVYPCYCPPDQLDRYLDKYYPLPAHLAEAAATA